MKTVDFLDAVKVAYGLTSDYQLAKKLSINPNRISNYRNKVSFMDDLLVMQIAELLELDALYVVACVHAEREERQGAETLANFWRGVAENMPENRLTFAPSAA